MINLLIRTKLIRTHLIRGTTTIASSLKWLIIFVNIHIKIINCFNFGRSFNPSHIHGKKRIVAISSSFIFPLCSSTFIGTKLNYCLEIFVSFTEKNSCSPRSCFYTSSKYLKNCVTVFLIKQNFHLNANIFQIMN